MIADFPYQHPYHILSKCIDHRIGWWENLQESPIFDGKTWFPVDFPLNQSIE